MVAVEEPVKEIAVRDLLEAGLHFGHQTKRWNPKMKRYIFDKRNGIHIIDLAKSLVMLKAAIRFVQDTVASGRSVLFVGTKKQAQQIVKEIAGSCGQPSVTTRWLGGTLTNNATIRQSVRRMRELEDQEKKDGFASIHKKEAARLRHELEKLRRNLSGIADMDGRPGGMFVVDINREAIAVSEANKLGIPVIAIVDTNCDPDPVDYVIPGNDDAIRAVRLVAGAIGETIRAAAGELAKLTAETARRKEADRAAEELRKAAEPQDGAKAVVAGAVDPEESEDGTARRHRAPPRGKSRPADGARRAPGRDRRG